MVITGFAKNEIGIQIITLIHLSNRINFILKFIFTLILTRLNLFQKNIVGHSKAQVLRLN
jgi:hypothetical protein